MFSWDFSATSEPKWSKLHHILLHLSQPLCQQLLADGDDNAMTSLTEGSVKNNGKKHMGNYENIWENVRNI